jgi:hypothetical protein
MPDIPAATALAATARRALARFTDPSPMAEIYAYLDEQLSAGVPDPDVSKRASRWLRALYLYEGFHRVHDRTARENTRNRATLPPSERRLGEWARYQRRFEDALNSYQRIRLDVSPAFVWDLHNNAWQLNLEACAQHLYNTGNLPILNGADPAEFRLARWLGRQLRQLQTGTLAPQRVLPLRALLGRGHLLR